MISVLHIGQVDGFYYYVLPLADSYPSAPAEFAEVCQPRTLESDLQRSGRLNLEETATVVRQLLDAVQHLHERDLLHRDIKPANVIFVDGAPQLADVGLLARGSQRAFVGLTPKYAPKEGIIDRSGDLYCLGRLLHECLTGWQTTRKFSTSALLPEAAQALAAARPLLEKACAEDSLARSIDVRPSAFPITSPPEHADDRNKHGH